MLSPSQQRQRACLVCAQPRRRMSGRLGLSSASEVLFFCFYLVIVIVIVAVNCYYYHWLGLSSASCE